MDRCVTDEPVLDPVTGDDDPTHVSACWLPLEALGLGEDAERLRQRAVEEGRVRARPAAAARNGAPEASGAVDATAGGEDTGAGGRDGPAEGDDDGGTRGDGGAA
jgi:hypothetical protein